MSLWVHRISCRADQKCTDASCAIGSGALQFTKILEPFRSVVVSHFLIPIPSSTAALSHNRITSEFSGAVICVTWFPNLIIHVTIRSDLGAVSADRATPLRSRTDPDLVNVTGLCIGGALCGMTDSSL
jgi:hypothetical protein